MQNTRVHTHTHTRTQVINCSLFNPTPSLCSMVVNQYTHTHTHTYIHTYIQTLTYALTYITCVHVDVRRTAHAHTYTHTQDTHSSHFCLHTTHTHIHNSYKMRPGVLSFNLSGMGCSAGVIAIGTHTYTHKSEFHTYKHTPMNLYTHNTPSTLHTHIQTHTRTHVHTYTHTDLAKDLLQVHRDSLAVVISTENVRTHTHARTRHTYT